MTTTDILNDLESTNAWQEELYVRLHQNPELSMMETETAAEITRRLESFGYDVQKIGGGVVGVLATARAPRRCSAPTSTPSRCRRTPACPTPPPRPAPTVTATSFR